MRFFSISLASFAQVGLLALLGLILAKVLPPEDFGIIRTVSSYMLVLTMLGHFCLHDGVSTFSGSSADIRARRQYVTTGNGMTLVISSIVSLAFIAFVLFSDIYVGQLRNVLLWVGIFIPFGAVTIVNNSLLTAVGNYRGVVVSLLLGGLAPLLLILPMAYHGGLSGWIWGRGVSFFLLWIASIWQIRKFLSWEDLSLIRGSELLRFSRVQLLSGLLSIGVQNADIILLERLSGNLAEIGMYGLAALFCRSLMLIPGTLGKLEFKDLLENSHTHYGEKLARRFVIKMTFLSIIMAVLVYAIVPSLIRFFYTDVYGASVSLVKIMAAGIVFSGIWNALSVVNVAYKRNKDAVMISLCGILIMLPFLFLLAPRYGAKGVAWSVNIAYAGGALLGLFLMGRTLANSRAVYPASLETEMSFK